jgi:hypothetical protein
MPQVISGSGLHLAREEDSVMRKRHSIVTTGLLGLCLTATTACGNAYWADTVMIPIGSVETATPTPGSSAPESPAPETPAPETSATTDMPKGFKPVGSAASGLVVAIPESWIALDLSKDDLEQGLRRSGLSGPALERAKQSLQPLVDNRAIWASDPASTETSPNRFATNLNGYCQSGPKATVDELMTSARTELEQLNAKVSEAAEMPIDSGAAGRVIYSFTTNGITVKGTQYYVPARDKTCIVTLSTDQEGKQELFDSIGKTIRPI